MHSVRTSLFAGLAALALAGCTSQPVTPPDGATACPTQRSQMCTREYQPVTGFDADGQSLGEYGNRCTACADHSVIYTVPAMPN